MVATIPCPFVPALLSSAWVLTVRDRFPVPTSLTKIACPFAPKPLMSAEELATTETVKLPFVSFEIWRPWPALPVTDDVAVRLTVPPPVRFTRTPALLLPDAVTAPWILIVFVVVFVSFMYIPCPALARIAPVLVIVCVPLPALFK